MGLSENGVYHPQNDYFNKGIWSPTDRFLGIPLSDQLTTYIYMDHL